MKATLNMHGLAGCGTVLIWWSYVLSSSVCIWRAVCVSKACMGRKSDKAILELSVRGHQIWILMSGLLINWVDRRVYFRAKSKLSISLFFKKSLNFFFVNGRRTHCYSQIQSTTHNSLHILIQFIGNGKFKGVGWINVPVLLIGPEICQNKFLDEIFPECSEHVDPPSRTDTASRYLLFIAHVMLSTMSLLFNVCIPKLILSALLFLWAA